MSVLFLCVFLELLQTTQKVDRDEGRKKDNRQLVVTYNKRKVSLETDPSMASKTYWMLHRLTSSLKICICTQWVCVRESGRTRKTIFTHYVCCATKFVCCVDSMEWNQGENESWLWRSEHYLLCLKKTHKNPQSGSVKNIFSWFVGNHETDGMIINGVSPAWVKGLMLWNVLHLMMNINYIYLYAYSAHRFLAVCVCMVQLRWSLNCVHMQFLLNHQPLWDHPVILFWVCYVCCHCHVPGEGENDASVLPPLFFFLFSF